MEFELLDEREFKKYLDTLPRRARFDLLALIESIEDVGMIEAMKKGWVSKIQKNLYEIRCETNGLFPRALFFRIKEQYDSYNADPRYIITNVFSKKTNKTPKREIAKSLTRMRHYMSGRK